jgi:hypothetical protein
MDISATIDEKGRNKADYRPDEVKLFHLKLFLASQGVGFPGGSFPYATRRLTLIGIKAG